MDPLSLYLSLPEADRASPGAAATLSSLLSALSQPSNDPLPETRRKLISHLLSSLSPTSAHHLLPSSPSTVLLPTLSLLKLLGRSPAGSEELSRESALRTLLTFGGLSRIAGLDRDMPTGRDPLLPNESEGLRCLCNTLMLHPSARDLFPVLVMENRSWVAGMVRLLPVDGAGFLSGRLLFLLTSKPGEIIPELAEKGDVVAALVEFANRYIATLRTDPLSLTTGPVPTPHDTLREHLKTAYNLMLQYGRLPPPSISLSPPLDLAHSDDDELSDAHTESTAGPGSRPTSPALGVGADGSIGKAGGEKEKKKRFWEKTGATSKDKEGREDAPQRSKSPRLLAKRLKDAVIGSSSSSSSSSSSNSIKAPPLPALSQDGGELTLSASTLFLPLFQPYLTLSVLLPLGDDPKSPNPALLSALNTLLNFPIALEELDGFTHSWLQPVDYARVAHASIGLAPLPSRILELLERTCDAWFPTNLVPKGFKGKTPVHPDELIPKGMGESARAEEILGPLMLLLRKLSMLSDPALQLRYLLLPDDIDRSIPLERRTDLTGHLIRLLSSIMLPNTAYGVGELLYNLCDRNPTRLCTTIGYGNASGFLQNRGELIPPPSIPSKKSKPTSSSTSGTASPRPSGSWERPTVPKPTSSRLVNPITGAFEVPPEANAVEMTEEEKHREAERLYVLFDRMAKTGVMEVENPVRKAQSEGRFVETSEEEEETIRVLKEQEEMDEEAVERDLKAYKARKARA